MNHWTNSYIGIPHADLGHSAEGANCWGLAVLVYAEQLAITLPTYQGDYVSLEEGREIAQLVDQERNRSVWQPAANAKSFDLAVFRRGVFESHIGIVVSPGLMLHVSAGEHARIEHYTAGKWGHRLTGIYRHVEAASKVAA